MFALNCICVTIIIVIICNNECTQLNLFNFDNKNSSHSAGYTHHLIYYLRQMPCPKLKIVVKTMKSDETLHGLVSKTFTRPTSIHRFYLLIQMRACAVFTSNL